MTGSYVLDALLFLYALPLTGVALIFAITGSRDLLVLVAAGSALGIFSIPFLDFAVAMLWITHISAALVVAVSTPLMFGSLGWGWWRHGRTQKQAPGGAQTLSASTSDDNGAARDPDAAHG